MCRPDTNRTPSDPCGRMCQADVQCAMTPFAATGSAALRQPFITNDLTIYNFIL